MKKWIQIRKDLYEQVENQVHRMVGDDTNELMRYKKIYDKEFTKKWKRATRDELLQQVSEASVVMMGDFHALHQSQKAQIRILRQLPRERRCVLAVEFFESRIQKDLNLFLGDLISENEFLKRIDWENKWGFPWDHYRPLILWAKEHKVPIFGINKTYKSRTAGTLKARDKFAAQKIAQLMKHYPGDLIFVIYGDLHLAQSHIPQELGEIAGAEELNKVVRIFQNSENIHFSLLRKGLEDSTDVVRISKSSFCLQSVPPWVKWQNYLLYLEKKYDESLVDFYQDDDDEDEDYEEGSIDYTDYVGRYVKLMAEELGLSINVGNLSVYTASDSYFWEQVRDHLSLRQIKWIELMISGGFSFYIPEIEAAYLARSSVNHAASLAMNFIHSKVCRLSRSYFDFPNDFLSVVWMQAISYFGSKMINPKRKTDTILDLKSHLHKSDFKDGEKEALKLALSQKMLELLKLSNMNTSRTLIVPRKKWSYIVAARLLGGMLGERLFSGYSKKLISTQQVATFLRQKVGESDFESHYYKVVKLAETVPAPFVSKKEKL